MAGFPTAGYTHAIGMYSSCSSTSTSTSTQDSADNASLIDIQLNVGQLDQIFQASSLSYTVTAGYLTSSIQITANAENENATITINGIATDSGVASNLIALTEGDTTYAVIEVTSVDATTSKGYTLEIYRESLQVFAQQAYIKASNTGNYDAFGDSLALSGDTLAVGADSEDSSGTGVNSVTQGDNSAAGSGAVYVFY